jgi:hypothetical protein
MPISGEAMTIPQHSRRHAQVGRKYGDALVGVLRTTYGEDFALGCRQIAAQESDDDERAFWLGLADEWEKWESARKRRH